MWGNKEELIVACNETDVRDWEDSLEGAIRFDKRQLYPPPPFFLVCLILVYFMMT